MFRFLLAPLEDYSDNAFRTLCFNHGADLTFTEMARVEGFVRRNKPTLKKAEIHDATPVEIQLLAGREDQLEKYLAGFSPFPGFMGFNLNLSCPSKDVMKSGRGAAMVKRVAKTQRLAALIKKKFPEVSVSLKLRPGMNDFEKKHKVYLNSIKGVDADYYIVHAKTASQRSDEPCDDSIYTECVEAANKKPIIANGGLNSVVKIKKVQSMGVKGIMIGRAAIKNPAIFDCLKNGLNMQNKKIPSIEELKNEYLFLSKKFNAPSKYNENVLKELGKK